MKKAANRVFVYDTTLRDGAQGEGISFSSTGKLNLARRLDQFGVDYIEGGYAGSNRKDMDFFRDIIRAGLKNFMLPTFSGRRRKRTRR